MLYSATLEYINLLIYSKSLFGEFINSFKIISIIVIMDSSLNSKAAVEYRVDLKKSSRVLKKLRTIK